MTPATFVRTERNLAAMRLPKKVGASEPREANISSSNGSVLPRPSSVSRPACEEAGFSVDAGGMAGISHPVRYARTSRALPVATSGASQIPHAMTDLKELSLERQIAGTVSDDAVVDSHLGLGTCQSLVQEKILVLPEVPITQHDRSRGSNVFGSTPSDAVSMAEKRGQHGRCRRLGHSQQPVSECKRSADDSKTWSRPFATSRAGQGATRPSQA